MVIGVMVQIYLFKGAKCNCFSLNVYQQNVINNSFDIMTSMLCVAEISTEASLGPSRSKDPRHGVNINTPGCSRLPV